MTTNAKIGWNTILYRGNGASPEVFTSVGEAKDIDGASVTHAWLDATHNESPEGYVEEIPGLKNKKQVTFRMNYCSTDTQQQALINDAENQTLRNFQLKENDTSGRTLSFAAYVEYDITRPTTGIREMSITLNIPGALTWS